VEFRRTFAANVAGPILGDLVYLKHHYKHWSLDMTALYALNTQQEQELFGEVLHAVREKKVQIKVGQTSRTYGCNQGRGGPNACAEAKMRIADRLACRPK